MKKSFKIGVVAVLLIIASAVVFSFATNAKIAESKKTESDVNVAKKLVPVAYKYIGPPACVPFDATDIANLRNPANWQLITSGDPDVICLGGDCACALRFNDATTTLAEAIDIIADRFEASQPVVHGTPYTVGSDTATFLYEPEEN